MDKKCSKYEGLFIFSDEETLKKHIEECPECRAEHEKMQKVSELIEKYQNTEDENKKMAKEFFSSLPKGTEIELNSNEDNPLTIEAIKFARKYKGHNYGDPALIRFLTDYCKVKSTVSFGTMKSKMGKIRKKF